MKNSWKKRFLAGLLAFLMVMCDVPASLVSYTHTVAAATDADIDHQEDQADPDSLEEQELEESEEEKAARLKAEEEEAARKKEEANKKAGYDLLCKAYGKKYVDAAMKGNLIIGMPVDLFLLGYPNTRLRQQSQGTKVYEVRNILNKITKVVRVRNGRVSGVTNY